ncbi:hypothetical protein [Nocardia sp. NPDC004604]|uniref:hypothetical protein n=1 Tax=Nocardia sp. NPDC004604 TaxID=3157013 RepID=UPI0033B5CDB6
MNRPRSHPGPACDHVQGHANTIGRECLACRLQDPLDGVIAFDAVADLVEALSIK